jgi:hypothetical protein
LQGKLTGSAHLARPLQELSFLCLLCLLLLWLLLVLVLVALWMLLEAAEGDALHEAEAAEVLMNSGTYMCLYMHITQMRSIHIQHLRRAHGSLCYSMCVRLAALALSSRCSVADQ